VLIIATLLAVSATGCGSEHPAGTISEDDLPDSVKVDQIRTDGQAGQIDCKAANDAEDVHVMMPSDNDDRDRRAAIAYELSGDDHQEVSNSVWRLPHPKEAVAAVAAGIDECAQAQPTLYMRFDVEGYPEALGYIATEGAPTPVSTRRILVPLSDRVVIVTSRRQGGSDFTVGPEALLEKALKASEDAPKS